MKIELMLCVAALAAVAFAAPIAEFNGPLTDKLSGWTWQGSHSNKAGLTFNQFEGYYPDKGGKLVSKRIKLDKAPGESAYYRLTFSARSSVLSYQGVDFYGPDGKLLPDCYDTIYPGARRSYDRVIYAMGSVDSIEVFFQSNTGIEAWDLAVEKTDWKTAVAYCDRVFNALPAFDDAWVKPVPRLARELPRTAAATTNGRPFRVVMLGDSIMQDTFHSLFHAKFKEAFPKSDFTWIISMRGSTGCWYYQDPEHFRCYVVDQKPDLLVIGGISNFINTRDIRNSPDVAALEQVIRSVHTLLPDCEIIFCSAPLSVDLRAPSFWPFAAAPIPVLPWPPENLGEGTVPMAIRLQAAGVLPALCRKCHVPYFDMSTPTYTWLFASGAPLHFYSRDAVHSNEKGKQIIGRTLLNYFEGLQTR